jgi:dipeptidyl aminopeptidase/acylaminoacyl peptidase
MVQRPRNSPLAGLVFLGAVVALGLLASAVVRFGAGIRAPAEAEETQEANKWREAEVDALDEARDGFETQLVREMTAPGPAALPELPEGVSLVRYPSGDHTFPAWLSESEGEDRPAVLLLHDASGLDAALWKEAAVLREAGFVVMAPTLRAEHGNPGTFEWQYGEVDDVVAAGQYLAGLSNVDSDDISLVGVGSGGDLALLAAMVSGPADPDPGRTAPSHRPRSR